MLEHIGSGLSLWPAHNAEGGLNIVTGNSFIASQIMTLLLLQPGENPNEPNMGISPDIFEPMSNEQPKIWQYEASNQIRKYIPDLRSFNVYIPKQEGTFNELIARVDFAASLEPSNSTLTFGWYQYVGIRNPGTLSPASYAQFRETIALNGKFFRLR